MMGGLTMLAGTRHGGVPSWRLFFFFNDTATTEIYTLSLHDALPISGRGRSGSPGDSRSARAAAGADQARGGRRRCGDRKSTRLNSSHSQISYAVFCLKKKKASKSASTRRTSR